MVKQYVKIPVYVMIRPRGGDFLYSDQEVQVMRNDIELMKNHGADGLVLGALTEDGQVDAELCMELLGNVLQCEKSIVKDRKQDRETLISPTVRQAFIYVIFVFIYVCLYNWYSARCIINAKFVQEKQSKIVFSCVIHL